jgi:hypothetical protein
MLFDAHGYLSYFKSFEVVLKNQITPKGKAQADSKAESRHGVISM